MGALASRELHVEVSEFRDELFSAFWNSSQLPPNLSGEPEKHVCTCSLELDYCLTGWVVHHDFGSYSGEDCYRRRCLDGMSVVHFVLRVHHFAIIHVRFVVKNLTNYELSHCSSWRRFSRFWHLYSPWWPLPPFPKLTRFRLFRAICLSIIVIVALTVSECHSYCVHNVLDICDGHYWKHSGRNIR
jgi:hypothetical protein